MNMAEIKAACMDLLFPPVCAACGVRLTVGSPAKLCPDCCRSIRRLAEPLCPICGMEQLDRPEGSGHLCGGCLARPPAYDLARSLFRYETAVRQLVHTLKFAGDTSVAGAIRQLAGSADLSPFADCQLILPVPLHRLRLQRRGLNQAAVLARLLFPGRQGAIRPDGLIRVRETVAQTKLRGTERRKNLRDAFRVNPSCPVARSIVCLVDDVFTTGTTVEACSRALKHQGAVEVRVVTLARAGKTGGRR